MRRVLRVVRAVKGIPLMPASALCRAAWEQRFFIRRNVLKSHFFKTNRPEWADRHRWNNNTALCSVRESVMLLIRFPLMPSCSSERKALRVTLRNLRKRTGGAGAGGGNEGKRAEKLEWVKLTQLKWIHNIVNNTRPTVSRGCCSFIFKCFRYAVVLQPSSPTVFGRVQPDSWLPAFGESHISDNNTSTSRGSWFDRALWVQCSVWVLPQVLQYFYLIDGGPWTLRWISVKANAGIIIIILHGPKTIEKSWGKPQFHGDVDHKHSHRHPCL